MKTLKKPECSAKACAGKYESEPCKLGKCAYECKRHRPVSKVYVKCDVGWGNTLFIRGEGASLNWDKGVPLTYVKTKKLWMFKSRSTKPIEFKVLINDERWSEGENFVLESGKTLEIEPTFV